MSPAPSKGTGAKNRQFSSIAIHQARCLSSLRLAAIQTGMERMPHPKYTVRNRPLNSPS